ncbi:MAG: FAD:protein FMN transferase [Paracoccaceae bacterium]
MNRRNLLLSATATGLCAALPAYAATQNMNGPAFGGSWRLVMPETTDGAAVRGVITSVIADVDMLMSPWRDDSEISRFNRTNSTDLIPLSPPVCTVLAESRNIADLSDGAFDPCVGPAVHRFGFGPIMGGSGTFADLLLLPDAAQKPVPDLTLDLCGIAKGYALDRITEALDNLGLDSFLFELGGEVRARGHHPNARDWTVGIERPGRQLSFQRIIAPGSLALATSGISRNGFRDNARQVNHIIDPRSARPVANNIASVSVLAPTAMRADALATALMVMGPDAGVRFANRENIKALFLTGAGPNFDEIFTDQFSDHILA